VVELPYLANATDFDPLASEPSIELRWVSEPATIENCDVVVLPGSKHTLHDVRWMRESGLCAAVANHAKSRPVLGICGGMQMLGSKIADPSGVEGGGEEGGLALLPLVTEFASEKVTVPVRGRVAASALFGSTLGCAEFRGYEIHVGRSRAAGSQPFAHLEREGSGETLDGCISADGNVAGTYVHGLFDTDAFRWSLVDALRARTGLHPSAERCAFTAQREQRIDRLAETVRANLDIEAILRIARKEPE
jgi:cobyric acid synthase